MRNHIKNVPYINTIGKNLTEVLIIQTYSTYMKESNMLAKIINSKISSFKNYKS